MMQRMATLRPIWQAAISAAVTVGAGLVVLAFYLALV
jgi:hypothetical protein